MIDEGETQQSSSLSQDYRLFPMFAQEPKYFEKLVQEIAPDMPTFNSPVEQVVGYLGRLAEGVKLGTLHQLALITKLRQALSVDEFDTQFEIVTQTRLVDICAQILSLNLPNQEYYYMQLEAYWILTNLAMGDKEVVDMILGFEPISTLGYKSPIFDLVRRDLETHKFQDIQRFMVVCHFINNVSDDQSHARHIVCQTQFIEVIEATLKHNNFIKVDHLKMFSQLTTCFARVSENIGLKKVQSLSYLTNTGLLREETVEEAIKATLALCEKHPDFIPQICTNKALSVIVQHLNTYPYLCSKCILQATMANDDDQTNQRLIFE
jgi:hypothetical protein